MQRPRTLFAIGLIRDRAAHRLGSLLEIHQHNSYLLCDKTAQAITKPAKLGVRLNTLNIKVKAI